MNILKGTRERVCERVMTYCIPEVAVEETGIQNNQIDIKSREYNRVATGIYTIGPCAHRPCLYMLGYPEGNY